MGRLFEGFEILCTGYDHMLEKSGDIIQGKTLYKGGHYSRKYGNCKGIQNSQKCLIQNHHNKFLRMFDIAVYPVGIIKVSMRLVTYTGWTVNDAVFRCIFPWTHALIS